MRIKIGNQWLAGVPGDPLKSQASELQINGQRLTQIVEPIRAEAVRSFARGNLRTEVSFKVHRLHASVDAAEFFILTHFAELPPQADVLFQMEPPDAPPGAEPSRILLLSAVIENTTHSHTGLTTIHEYRLLGGEPFKP